MKRQIAMLLVFALLLSGCVIQERPEETTRFSIVKPTEDTSVPTTQPTQDETNPTQGETQPPVILEIPEDDAIVRVTDYIPGIQEVLAYATVNNFTGQRIYDFTDAYLRYGTVKKLKAVSEELAGQGIGLLIWDGFRPVDAQQKLWDICPDPTFVSHPVTGQRTHCRGNAVDLTLMDLKPERLCRFPRALTILQPLQTGITQTALNRRPKMPGFWRTSWRSMASKGILPSGGILQIPPNTQWMRISIRQYPAVGKRTARNISA